MDMKGHLSPVLRTDVARTSPSLSGEMERELLFSHFFPFSLRRVGQCVHSAAVLR